MELLRFLGVLRRWWPMLLLGAVAGVVLSILFVDQQPARYQSSTRLLIDQVQAPGPVTLADVQTSQQLTKTYSELLHSRPILTQTIAQFTLPFTPEDLNARLVVSPVRDTQILQVAVSDTDAERATTTVNGLAQVFIKYIQDIRSGKIQASLQQVDRDIESVQAQITDTSSRLNGLRANIDATSSTALELQRLQQLLSQYDQDLRDIRQQSVSISSRINDLRATPQPNAATTNEIDRLQKELAQYDADAQNIRARFTETSTRLDQLRAVPVTGNIAQDDAQRLQEQLAQYQDKYRRLIDARQTITNAKIQNGASVIVTDPAQVPLAPIPSHAQLKLPLAGSIGLLLAFGVVLSIEFFDDRMRDPGEMQQRFGITPLAVLGFRRRGRLPIFRNATRNATIGYTDALRTLRTNLGFVMSDRPVVICITSALEREGKSSVAMNLALLEAETGKRVILIDANLRHPTIHRQLGLANEDGLSTLLSASGDDHEPDLQEGPHGVKVLTSGPVLADPADLLASHRIADLVAMLRTKADIIILDTAAILPVPDTLVLQQLVDGTLLIVDMEHTGRKSIEELIVALELAHAKIIGAVLNKADHRALRRGYQHSPRNDRRHLFAPHPSKPAVTHGENDEDLAHPSENSHPGSDGDREHTPEVSVLGSSVDGDEGQDRDRDHD
jgi:succinoglycan biosynthesis transport protein ExoP